MRGRTPWNRPQTSLGRVLISLTDPAGSAALTHRRKLDGHRPSGLDEKNGLSAFRSARPNDVGGPHGVRFLRRIGWIVSVLGIEDHLGDMGRKVADSPD